jgi:hypothetical protein
LEKGLNYAVERLLANNINRTIIDMENVIIKLDEHLSTGYRIIAFNKLKRIAASYPSNTMHKTMHYITKKLKQKLLDSKLTIVEADKGQISVIIEQETLNRKIQNFLHENKYKELATDPR